VLTKSLAIIGRTMEAVAVRQGIHHCFCIVVEAK
jgi:hypothetical protein